MVFMTEIISEWRVLRIYNIQYTKYYFQYADLSRYEILGTVPVMERSAITLVAGMTADN
jgi:hypothetical protein